MDQMEERKIDHSTSLVRTEPRSNKRSRIEVISVSEISPVWTNSAFEGIVLSRYGNYDQPTKQTQERWTFLRCDMTDKIGMCTVTIMMSGSMVGKHSSKIKNGNYLRLERFSIVSKYDYDYGDIKYTLRIEHDTVVEQIAPFNIHANFVATNKIISLKIRRKISDKRDKASFCTFTVAVAVIKMFGQAEGVQYERYDMQIADGKTSADIQTVTFWESMRQRYFDLQKIFQEGFPMLLLLKNLQGSMKNGLLRLTVQPYTIFATITDPLVRTQLLEVYKSHSSIVENPGTEILGVLTMTNINAPPFEFVCTVCQSKKLMQQPSGMCFCRSCDNVRTLKKIGLLTGELEDEAGKMIEINIQGAWAETILQLSESLPSMYDKDPSLVRQKMIETEIKGKFMLDNSNNLTGMDVANIELINSQPAFFGQLQTGSTSALEIPKAFGSEILMAEYCSSEDKTSIVKTSDI